MSSIKYEAPLLTAAGSQPVLGAISTGVLSVRGAKKISVHVEPGTETCTGWVYRVGYTFPLRTFGDPDRIRYSFADTITVTGRASPGTLLGYQDAEGRWNEFDVPTGADKCFVQLVSVETAGSVNLLVGSS